jgi:hypothetical protein
MPRMRPYVHAGGCAWRPPTPGARGSRDLQQLTCGGSALATNDNGRHTRYRQGRPARAHLQPLEQRWSTQDGLNRRTPTHRRRNGSRCALESALPERDPAQGGRHPRGERLARRSGAAHADGLAHTPAIDRMLQERVNRRSNLALARTYVPQPKRAEQPPRRRISPSVTDAPRAK